MYGSIIADKSGNIKAHVGKDCFTTIKSTHCKKIQDLRTDLIDLFIKHFSKETLTAELIRARDYIEENVESLIAELHDLISKNDVEGFNRTFHILLMNDLNLSIEGMPLTEKTK